MAAREVRWGILASARRLRVVLLRYHRIESVRYPYISMSDDIPIDSAAEPVIQILLCMLLKGSNLEPDFLSGEIPIALPANDPYAHPPGRTRNRSKEIRLQGQNKNDPAGAEQGGLPTITEVRSSF